jgi:hypothetical protein
MNTRPSTTPPQGHAVARELAASTAGNRPKRADGCTQVAPAGPPSDDPGATEYASWLRLLRPSRS